jgi:hypothetical protein
MCPTVVGLNFEKHISGKITKTKIFSGKSKVNFFTIQDKLVPIIKLTRL